MSNGGRRPSLGRYRGAASSWRDRFASRVVSRVVREAQIVSDQRSAVDTIVDAIMADPETRNLANPVRYVDLLRRAFLPTTYDVRELRNVAEHAQRAGQFGYLLAELSRGVAPLPVPDAVRMARVADEIGASREPMGWVDVGSHFGRASSFARKGRLLQAAVRHVRARKVLELGTAYGMGTLFLAAAVGKEGVVTTVECMQPQARISADVLAQHFPDRVHTLEGFSTQVIDEVASVASTYDLFFHDAEHSHKAYVEDFLAFEPMLAPGAVVIYDDITWRRAKQLAVDPDPYGGWLEVVEHPRVLRAAEVDGDYGLLLLK